MNLLSIALAASLSCQPVGDRNLIGLWESSKTSKGGIGSNIEFRSDGSYTSAIVVLVDLNYDVKDGKLFIGKNKGEPVSYEQGAEITLRSDVLTLKGENGETELRNRINKNNGNTIIGNYKYRHYTGGIAYEQYTKDGLLKLRIPMRTYNGCYSIDGKNISIEQSGKEKVKVEFKVEGNGLKIIEPNKSTSYELVKEGAWYKSDEIDYKEPQE